MINQFLKIGGVTSTKDFYKKYATEDDFFRAHPEAQYMQDGGTKKTKKQLKEEEKAAIEAARIKQLYYPIKGHTQDFKDSTIIANQLKSPMYDPTRVDFRTVEHNVGEKNATTDVYKKNLKTGTEQQLQPYAWDPSPMKQFMFNQDIKAGRVPRYSPTFWPTPEQQAQIQQIQAITNPAKTKALNALYPRQTINPSTGDSLNVVDSKQKGGSKKKNKYFEKYAQLVHQNMMEQNKTDAYDEMYYTKDTNLTADEKDKLARISLSFNEKRDPFEYATAVNNYTGRNTIPFTTRQRPLPKSDIMGMSSSQLSQMPDQDFGAYTNWGTPSSLLGSDLRPIQPVYIPNDTPEGGYAYGGPIDYMQDGGQEAFFNSMKRPEKVMTPEEKKAVIDSYQKAEAYRNIQQLIKNNTNYNWEQAPGNIIPPQYLKHPMQIGGPINSVAPNIAMTSYVKGNTKYVKDLTDKGWYTATHSGVTAVAPIQTETIPQGQIQTGYTNQIAGSTKYFVPHGNSWAPATDSEYSRLGYDTTNVNPYTNQVNSTPIDQQRVQQLNGQPLAVQKEGGSAPRFEDTNFVDNKKNDFLKWLRQTSFNKLQKQLDSEQQEFMMKYGGECMDCGGQHKLQYGGGLPRYQDAGQYGGMTEEEKEAANEAFWANNPSVDRVDPRNNTYNSSIPFLPVPEDPKLMGQRFGYSTPEGTFNQQGNQMTDPYGKMPQIENRYVSSSNPNAGQQTINLAGNPNLQGTGKVQRVDDKGNFTRLSDKTDPELNAPVVKTYNTDPRTEAPTPKTKQSFNWQSLMSNIPDGETKALKKMVGIDAITSILNAKERKKREKELKAQTHADMVFSPIKGNMVSPGDYSVNEGYIGADLQVPTQFTGASGQVKRGGQYKQNQDYYLSDKEIQKLRDQGYQIAEY